MGAAGARITSAEQLWVTESGACFATGMSRYDCWLANLLGRFAGLSQDEVSMWYARAT